MVLEELVEILRFDFDDKDLKTFNGAVKDATKALAAVGAVAAAAGGAIFAFTKEVAETTDEMGKQAEIMGVTSEAYQELIHSAELNGSSQDSLRSSIIGVSKAASEAARGTGAGIEAFALLGVEAMDAAGNIKSADELLLDVADSLDGIGSQAEKIELLSKLGISDDMILMLDQGSDAMRRQMQEARDLGFVLSEEATKASAEFNDELLAATKTVKGIGNQIAVSLMPGMTEMLTTFKEWVIENRAMIKQNIAAFLDKTRRAIAAVFNIASRVVNVINALVDAVGGWEIALMGAAAAFAILNASALALPALVIAIAAGIFLLVEDIITFAQGGESAIGSLVDILKTDLGKAVEGLGILIDRWIVAPFNSFVESLKSSFASVSGFFGGFDLGLSALTPTIAGGGNTNATSNVNVTAPITVNATTGATAQEIGVQVREQIRSVVGDANRSAVQNLSGVVSQ